MAQDRKEHRYWATTAAAAPQLASSSQIVQCRLVGLHGQRTPQWRRAEDRYPDPTKRILKGSVANGMM